MRTLPLLSALVPACAVDAEGFGENGTRVDLTSAGTATVDEDEEGDDSASDTAQGAVDTANLSSCTGTDLDFTVVLLDDAGLPTTTVSYPASVATTARFQNGCTGTVQFVTSSSCLVTTWSLYGAFTASFSGNCKVEPTTWSVAQGEAVEVGADWGYLDRGNWYATATSEIDGSTQTVFFTVQ
jgi:hypothetical protein